MLIKYEIQLLIIFFLVFSIFLYSYIEKKIESAAKEKIPNFEDKVLANGKLDYKLLYIELEKDVVRYKQLLKLFWIHEASFYFLIIMVVVGAVYTFSRFLK